MDIFVGDTVIVKTPLTVKKIVEDAKGVHYLVHKANDPWDLIQIEESDISDVLERT